MTGEKHRFRTILLWVLCLCLAVSAAGTARAEPTAFDMKVGDRIYTTGSRIPVGTGSRVRVEPIPVDTLAYAGWLSTQYWWMGSGWERANEGEYFAVVDVGMDDVAAYTTFKWWEWVDGSKVSEDGYARVTLVPIAPPTVDIWTTIPGDGLLVPGKATEFASRVTPAGAPSTQGYLYRWEVLKGGYPVSTELYDFWNTTTAAMYLQPKERGDVWKLDGSTVRCTVTDYGNSSLSAFAELPVYVAIKLEPAEKETVVVPGAIQDGYMRARLTLTSVIGGNAEAKGLSYRWQWRSAVVGSAWQDTGVPAGSQSGTYDVMVPETNVDYEFRCIVARAGETPDPVKDTISGTYVVSKRSVLFDIEDRVTLDPAGGVVQYEGEPTNRIGVQVKVLTPANKPTNPDATEYRFAILAEQDDGTWTAVDSVTPPTWTGAYAAGEFIEVTFIPAEGIHRYKLRASSDAAESAWDVTYPFTVQMLNTSAVEVTGSSIPVRRSDGKIHVKPGEPIEYTIHMKNGTKQWRVDWYEGGALQSDTTNPRWTDTTPQDGVAVKGEAFMVGYDGKGIPSPSWVVDTFGTPYIDLAWLTDLQSALIISKTSLISADGKLSITPRAEGGGHAAGDFRYFWYIADARDREPSPDDITGTGGGTFIFDKNNIPLDPDALGTQYFDLWLKATAGDQTIVDSVPLIVTDGSTLLLSAWLNGQNLARWTGNGYVATCYENGVPELRAALAEGEGAKYRWTVDGVKAEATGSTWTPTGLTAKAAPYTIVSEALDGAGEVTATTTIDLAVMDSYELNATAIFENDTVEPGAEAKLVITVQETSPDSLYTFKVGTSKTSMIILDKGTRDTSVTCSITAPSDPGTYTYWWSVSDSATGGGYTLKSTKLTVAGTIGALFTISPPEGATFVKGDVFYSEVVSLGSSDVTAAMLDWASSEESVATVDSFGRVTIHAAGEVTIKASLKTDTTQRSSYSFTATDGGGPVIRYRTGIPETLTFRPGQTVDVKFTSDPANAVYSGTNLLKGLTLSPDGHLTGTAPTEEGTYSLGSITVTWPDHSETFSAEDTVTVAKGGDSGSGGGCNGGFGMLTLALGAFLALKRR